MVGRQKQDIEYNQLSCLVLDYETDLHALGVKLAERSSYWHNDSSEIIDLFGGVGHSDFLCQYNKILAVL